MSSLAAIFPKEVQVDRVERRQRPEKSNIASQPIFKEGIYAEHFLPLWISSGDIRIGWDKHLSIEVKGTEPSLLARTLAPCVKGGEEVISAALKSNSGARISIDHGSAFEFLRKAAKEPLNAEESALADLLEGLHYCTAKKDVLKRIYAKPDKKFLAAKEITKEKDFGIKVDMSVGKGKSAKVKAKGVLLLPARNDWRALTENPAIAALLAQKIAPPANMRRILEQHFNSGGRPGHRAVRRVFSLPVLDAPSGGFRIRREKKSGEKIWQLHAIEGSPASGFPVDSNGDIDWGITVLLPALLNSDNVVPKGGRYCEHPESIISFDAWRNVQGHFPEGVSAVAIAPGTKDRRYIRVTQSFDSLARWLEVSTDNKSKPESPLDLQAAIKVDKGDFFKTHNTVLLGKPRSNLFVEQIGPIVTYWYIVESSNTTMKEAYQAAYRQS